MGKVTTIGIPMVLAVGYFGMPGMPGPASPNHAGPFWSIDYQASEPDALVTRRFEEDGDSILVRTYVNGFFQKRETWYRGVFRTGTESELGALEGMTPRFDTAQVDRLFPLKRGNDTKIDTRFEFAAMGVELSGCGWTKLKVADVYTRELGGFQRTVADIDFDNYLATYSTGTPEMATESELKRARAAEPEASAILDEFEEKHHGIPPRDRQEARRIAEAKKRIERRVATQMSEDGCGKGTLSEERSGPSGRMTIDVETGVPIVVRYEQRGAGESLYQRPIAVRLNYDGEAADIAAKAAMRDRAPRDPQTGLAYVPAGSGASDRMKRN